MTKVKMPGEFLPAAMRGLAEVGENRLRLMLAVRFNRQAAAVGEFYQPWAEQVFPLEQRYTGGPHITLNHPKYSEFRNDPEVRALFEEEVTIEIDPVALSELEGERHLEVSPDAIGVLIAFGLVVDDVNARPPKEA